MADGGGSQKAAKELTVFNNIAKDTTLTLKALGNQTGIVEFQFMRLRNLYREKLGRVHTLAVGLGKVTKMITGVGVESEKQRDELWNSMTVVQRLTTRFLQFSPVLVGTQIAMESVRESFADADSVMRFIALTSTGLASSFIGITMLTLGFVSAIGLLSIGLQGANTPLLSITENIGWLHSIVEGLVKAITGEGEGGLGDVIAGAAALGIVTWAIFSATVGRVVAMLTIALGVFRLVKEETGSMSAATLAAIATFWALYSSVSFIMSTFAPMITRIGIFIAQAYSGLLAGIAPILLGLAGLYAFATGALEGIAAFVLAIVSAVLIAIGLVLATVSAPVAIAIALILLIIATVVRFKEEIADVIGVVVVVITSAVGVARALLMSLASAFIGLGERVSESLIRLFIRMGQWRDNVKSLLSDLWGWIKAAPGNIYDAVVSGFKAIFNAVIGLYNDTLGSISFTIPDWVPEVGGKGWSVPNIPMLAEGGIVTAPTLALIGEKGPEAVVPLGKDGQYGTQNSITVNLNVSGVTDRSDKRALAREISDILNQELRRVGGNPTRGRF